MQTTGCGTAIVTPFKLDGSIDEPALRSLVDWQIESGIDFIVACGSTGEAATLDEDEWLFAVSVVSETSAGRVPVWAGCTHNSTSTLVRLARRVCEVPGIDAVLSASPYYNKPSQRGQFEHFLALARAIDPLPLTLYNVPGRTAVNLDPETVLRLAEAAPNIQAIKEAAGQVAQVEELVRILPTGFKIFSGDDGLALDSIEAGAHGLISVASNEIPADIATMIRLALNGQLPQARELQRRYAQLFEANFWDSNPGPVKTVLNLMGCISDRVRLPLVPPSPAIRAQLARLVTELDLSNRPAAERHATPALKA